MISSLGQILRTSSGFLMGTSHSHDGTLDVQLNIHIKGKDTVTKILRETECIPGGHSYKEPEQGETGSTQAGHTLDVSNLSDPELQLALDKLQVYVVGTAPPLLLKSSAVGLLGAEGGNLGSVAQHVTPADLTHLVLLNPSTNPPQSIHELRYSATVKIAMDAHGHGSGGKDQSRIQYKLIANNRDHPGMIFCESLVMNHRLPVYNVAAGGKDKELSSSSQSQSGSDLASHTSTGSDKDKDKDKHVSFVLSSTEFTMPDNNPFGSTAFTEAIFKNKAGDDLAASESLKALELNGHAGSPEPRQQGGEDKFIMLHFQILVPRIKQSQSVHFFGSLCEFGKWDDSKASRMKRVSASALPLYEIVMRVDKEEIKGAEWKFLIRDDSTNKTVYIEHGPNRLFKDVDSWTTAPPKADHHHRHHVNRPQNPDFVSISSEFRYYLPWKGAGVAIPVASLRTDNSVGIGEFYDLYDLIEWAKKINIQLIQILPVYDTGRDPSPYATSSVFALHPVYVRLQAVAHQIGLPNDHAIVKEILQAQRDLNASPRTDYQWVLDWKTRLLELLYEEDDKRLFDTEGFNAFIKRNVNWLPGYALWKVVLEETKEWDYRKWEVKASDVEKLATIDHPKYGKKIGLIYFTQYFLDYQLYEVSQAARNAGIVLKGDLPIGVQRYGADTFTSTKNFNMKLSAGCPSIGDWAAAQNWDFPLYDWEEMERTKYAWWKQRLEVMSRYFTACRIDHVLGFFRIFAMPPHNWTGYQGFFVPCVPLKLDELKKIRRDHAAADFNKMLDRMTNPYVRHQLLQKALPEYSEEQIKEVIAKFLQDRGNGVYNFKPEFSTVEKIGFALPLDEEGIADEEKEKRDKLRKVLWKLVDNRLLVVHEKNYYFTCHMLFTSSFEELNENPADQLNGMIVKSKLKELWQDFFMTRQNWRKEGLARLSALQQASSMMICGEDLGAVPDEAYVVLNQLGILGLRIQRWPPGGGPLLKDNEYPYLSVSASSCHDCSTLRAWYDFDDPKSAHKLYAEQLGKGVAPMTCTDVASQTIIESVFNSSSMWAIIPLQDLADMWGDLRGKDPREDAINRPGETAGCWSWKMRMTLNQLNQRNDFNTFLANLVERTGRFSAL